MQRHDERLAVPLWWWVPGIAVAALLAAEIHLGYPGIRAWLPYVVIVPGAAAALWWLGRIRVRVVAGELHVDDARLPVRYIASVRPVRGEAKRMALGPELMPLAFVVHRPWVPGAVVVTLDDPADPTPYWIVSSREPEQLARVLTDLRGQGRPGWVGGERHDEEGDGGEHGGKARLADHGAGLRDPGRDRGAEAHGHGLEEDPGHRPAGEPRSAGDDVE